MNKKFFEDSSITFEAFLDYLDSFQNSFDSSLEPFAIKVIYRLRNEFNILL